MKTRRTSSSHVLPRGSGVEVSKNTHWITDNQNNVIALTTIVTTKQPRKTVAAVSETVSGSTDNLTLPACRYLAVPRRNKYATEIDYLGKPLYARGK